MNKKDYKKFLLIKECVGTEPYLTERLEMDIKDIMEYTIIAKEEIHDHDIVRILGQSDNRNDLIELAESYRMENYYGY